MNLVKALFILVALTTTTIISAQENMLRFAIDKAQYNELSESQKNNLSIKVQELEVFVSFHIIKKIPKEIAQKLADLKIKISLANTAGRDGLFTPGNSGEHTIALQLNQLNTNGIKALLAHEIYHAIHFHLNPDELPWVREGMAQLFEYMATGEFNGRNLSAAIKNPLTPLLGHYDVNDSNPAQYGHNQLYFHYLYNQCGKEKIFWKITEAKNLQGQKGSYLIDEVLKEMKIATPQCEDFSSTAITFEVAKLHNQIQFTNEENKEQYVVSSMEISPIFAIPKTEKELEKTLKSLPVLSSYKIPLQDFKKLKGSCKNCEIFYAQKEFPYTIFEKEPKEAKESKGIDVILVKTQGN